MHIRTILTVGVISFFCASTAAAASKNPLVANIAKQASISEADAVRAIDQVMSGIKEELKAGRDVTIKNFGRFYVSERDAHEGRNPRTGQKIQIEARNYPRFVSSDGFKAEMNGAGKTQVSQPASTEAKAE